MCGNFLINSVDTFVKKHGGYWYVFTSNFILHDILFFTFKEKQNRKNVEQVQLKGWPGSQLVSWPGMFHPNPCGRLINNMNRCSGCNSVGKISTRDRARESIHLLIPCPVPIKEPSPTPPKRDFPRSRWAKISMGER